MGIPFSGVYENTFLYVLHIFGVLWPAKLVLDPDRGERESIHIKQYPIITLPQCFKVNKPFIVKT